MADSGHFDIIVHGCNCFCVMGAGIAAQIKDRYPEAYAVDCETKSGDKDKLGTYTYAQTSRGPIVINAYTQYSTNGHGPSQDLFDYAGFETILAALAHNAGDLRYGFPYIGMGLAGGDPEKIVNLLEKFADQVSQQDGSATLVKYQP
jgi:O-acetyl-ADP-ribose deacetylase (regulator of RNase III)